MLKIGVIGYGTRMRNIVGLALATGKCELAAIADSDIERVKSEIGKSHPDTSWYKSPKEMLENEKPDGVFIGTRCSTHTHFAVMASEYNIPIFLEKPVSTTKESLDSLKTIMELNEKIVVSFPLKLSKMVRTAKEIADSGTLGEISQIQAYNNVPYGRGYYHKWYRDDQETGGLFLQKATHDIDYINYILGYDSVKGVYATESKRIFKGDKPADLKCKDCPERETCTESDINVRETDPQYEPGEYCCFSEATGNQDCGTIIVEYENGLHAVYSQNFVVRKAAEKRGARFIGYNATMEFDFYNETITVYHHLENRVDTIKVGAEKTHSGGDFYLVKNFIDVMSGKDVSHSTLESGISSARLCLMAKKSASEHSFVENI